MAQSHALEASLAEALNDLRVDPDANVPRPVDLLGQSGRHAGIERAAPNHDRHVGRVLGQVTRRLRGHCRRPNDENLLAGERRRLRHGVRIDDTGPGQFVDAGNPERAIGHPGRNHQNTRGTRGAVGQRHSVFTAARRQTDRGIRQSKARTQSLSLLVDATREFGAAHAIHEARIVEDDRGRGGGSAGAVGVDHGRLQRTSGGHGGRQARRTGANHGDVVALAFRHDRPSLRNHHAAANRCLLGCPISAS